MFARDMHKCAMCSSPDDLDAHHITDRNELPNGGYVTENGIALCPPCHEKAEMYHASGHETHEPGFLPKDLYRIIKSSLPLALKASERQG